MNYAILIKTTNVNVSSYNWYCGTSGNTPWESANLEEALKIYQTLLATYASGNLSLVQIVPVSIAVKYPSNED